MTLEFKNQISIQPLEDSGSGLQFQNSIYIQPKDEGGGGGGDDTPVEFSLYEQWYDMTQSYGISDFLAGRGTAYLSRGSGKTAGLALLCSNWSKVKSISAEAPRNGWGTSLGWYDENGTRYSFSTSDYVKEGKVLTVTLTAEVRKNIYRTWLTSAYTGGDQYSQFKYTEL